MIIHNFYILLQLNVYSIIIIIIKMYIKKNMGESVLDSINIDNKILMLFLFLVK